ncbi:MAG: type II toxin-antitoxin system RelE/ParE family toxin [Hydrotalea sp.]|nr:type II toxin-antitoxin system RelE/ParE family toxin [Hydrotalea sp.]
MPKSYNLTNKAVDDLTNIWHYTNEKWSEEQADKYYSSLINTFEAIAKKPDLGKKYFNIFPDLYGFRINRHIIFYRKKADDRIEITRILYEGMDFENRLKY